MRCLNVRVLKAWSELSVRGAVVKRWPENYLPRIPRHSWRSRCRTTLGSLALLLALTQAAFVAQGDEAFTTVPVVSYDLYEDRETLWTANQHFDRVSFATAWRGANELRSARRVLHQPGDEPRSSRYLDVSAVKSEAFKLPGERTASGEGAVALGKLQAGYGRIFTPDSVITRGRNGTVWEDHSYIFLQARFRF
jgi:hypothetical protein